MEKSITVPLPADLAERLKREAARQDRPQAYVVRQCIDAALPRPQSAEVAA